MFETYACVCLSGIMLVKNESTWTPPDHLTGADMHLDLTSHMRPVAAAPLHSTSQGLQPGIGHLHTYQPERTGYN